MTLDSLRHCFAHLVSDRELLCDEVELTFGFSDDGFGRYLQRALGPSTSRLAPSDGRPRQVYHVYDHRF